MDGTKLRSKIISTFNLNGFSLQREASTYLVGILAEYNENQQMLWLDRIIDKVQKQNLTSSLIRKDILELAAKECGKGDQHEQSDVISFINALKFPKVSYDKDRKKFLPSTSMKSILAIASEKPQLFHNRYSLLLQRTLRHELFTPSIQGVEWESDRKKFNLKQIEYLAGCTSKVGDVIVLGMITQMKEGKYYLEDPTGAVQMDLTTTKFHTGLFTENCFVLAEGSYDDKIFSVNAIGLPPPEAASVSRTYHGAVNFFGHTSTLNQDKLLELESENKEAMFVFLTEVHLDNITVLEKVKILFQGYEDYPPVVFLFMGNFLTEAHGSHSCLDMRDGFKSLADIILEFPNIMDKSKFVFVPGPGDPGFVNILPRPPFPEVVTELFRSKIPNSVFMSNPCRIKFCSKEIVIFREDVMSKMCRNSIYFPTTGSIPTHFVKTLIGQCHLCPLPLQVCPIYWSFDHSLYLYPLPHLVVIGDKCDPFIENQLDTHFINPGSFVKTDFSFKVYYPYENKVDECQLPAE